MNFFFTIFSREVVNVVFSTLNVVFSTLNVVIDFCEDIVQI